MYNIGCHLVDRAQYHEVEPMYYNKKLKRLKQFLSYSSFTLHIYIYIYTTCFDVENGIKCSRKNRERFLTCHPERTWKC